MIKYEDKKFTPNQLAKAVLGDWLNRMQCCGVRMEGFNYDSSDKDMVEAQEHLNKHVVAIEKRLNLKSSKNNFYIK